MDAETSSVEPGGEQTERARAAALRLLKARDRTPRALERRLRIKGFDGDVVASVIARLEEVGLLDERATAERLVRAELRKAPASERLLRSRLLAEGVGGALAGEVIAAALRGVDQASAAEAEARRWLARRAGLDPDTARRRLASRLARRGFDGEVVRDAVARALRAQGP